ncbi:MAG: N-acetylmuramoyl-L-alanine amidase, partial [Rikenellaceae bacterium]
SIHANAASNPSAYGAETILMGESSLEQQRNEAALYTANRDQLLDMSNEKTATIVRAYIQNLQYTYGQYSEAFARLIQKNYGAQGRKTRNLRYQLIKVLYGTDMPCALTEIGFMTNPKEFAYMTSQRGQEEIARAIFNGIKEYVEMVNKTITPSTTQKTEVQQPQKSTQSIGYTIQILSSKKAIKPNDSQFKSYKGKTWEMITSASYKYKYYVGRYATKEEAQRELQKVQKSFKDAFITTYKTE